MLTPIRRRLSLLARLNSSLVLDLELDELSGGTFTHLLVPSSEIYKQLASGAALNRTSMGEKQQPSPPPPPDLWLMWRQRSSFNLLPAVIGGSHATQSNELQLGSVELSLLEPADELASTIDGANSRGASESGAQTSVTVIRYTMASPPSGVALAPLDPTIGGGGGGGGSEPVAALARAASRRAALVDELHLAITGGVGGGLNSATSDSQQDGSYTAAATLSAATMTSNNKHTLNRNHWHRFEPAKVERVAL